MSKYQDAESVIVDNTSTVHFVMKEGKKPDEESLNTLIAAAGRGVKVKKLESIKRDKTAEKYVVKVAGYS